MLTHRALHASALVALTVTALTAAPAALGQPSPDPAPVAPTLAPDPAPSSSPPPTQGAPPPASTAPAPVAPTSPAAPSPAPAPATSGPSLDQPAASARGRRARTERRRRTEREQSRSGTVETKEQPSITRAAFLRVESLLPRGETADDSSDTMMLLLAAGALLALVLASGAFTSVLARLMPPTAVLLVLLAAPATADAQSISPTCGTASSSDGCDRWYRDQSVTLNWTWAPNQGAVIRSGCVNATIFNETSPARRRCEVEWGSTTISKEVWIGIDRTPPDVTGIQSGRPPDRGSWFNHPVSLTFKGTDALSGIQSCTSTTFGGPEGADVLVPGSCTDVAGNTGSGIFPVDYDSVAPATPEVLASPRDGAVLLKWTPAADAEAEVARFHAGGSAVVHRGAGDSFTDTNVRNGERYRYVVTLTDQAGNRAAGEAIAVPSASPLFTPSTNVKSATPPLLTWRKVRGASYYNVQLFRGRRKILSSWPKANELQLKRRWRYRGRTRHLTEGRYCYVVWPGFGPRRERDYGRLLGRRCFRVTV